MSGLSFFALGLHAIGLASLIGSFFAPLLCAAVSIQVAAFELLGYIKWKD